MSRRLSEPVRFGGKGFFPPSLSENVELNCRGNPPSGLHFLSPAREQGVFPIKEDPIDAENAIPDGLIRRGSSSRDPESSPGGSFADQLPEPVSRDGGRRRNRKRVKSDPTT